MAPLFLSHYSEGSCSKWKGPRAVNVLIDERIDLQMQAREVTVKCDQGMRLDADGEIIPPVEDEVKEDSIRFNVCARKSPLIAKNMDHKNSCLKKANKLRGKAYNRMIDWTTPSISPLLGSCDGFFSSAPLLSRAVRRVLANSRISNLMAAHLFQTEP